MAAPSAGDRWGLNRLVPKWWLQRGSAVQAQASSSSSLHPAAGNSRPAPTHLVVLVNGLFGSASNWDVLCEALSQALPPDTLLHPSQVNSR
jgi:E3 ubiquitin-protein ligase FANCL